MPVRNVLFCTQKGTNLTTVHAKGSAQGVFSKSPGRGDDAADRALQLVLASAGKSALGDYMIVVSGRSNRHVMAISDHLISDLKDEGLGNARVEGLEAGDWVLIDTGDIIVHVFRPEIREFYNIERMWAAPEIEDETVH
jgi:ribosome-associated protein